MSNYKSSSYCMVNNLSSKVFRQKCCYSRGYCIHATETIFRFPDFWECNLWIPLKFTAETINQSSEKTVHFYDGIPISLEDYPWRRHIYLNILSSAASLKLNHGKTLIHLHMNKNVIISASILFDSLQETHKKPTVPQKLLQPFTALPPM